MLRFVSSHVGKDKVAKKDLWTLHINSEQVYLKQNPLADVCTSLTVTDSISFSNHYVEAQRQGPTEATPLCHRPPETLSIQWAGQRPAFIQ